MSDIYLTERYANEINPYANITVAIGDTQHEIGLHYSYETGTRVLFIHSGTNKEDNHFYHSGMKLKDINELVLNWVDSADLVNVYTKTQDELNDMFHRILRDYLVDFMFPGEE